MELKKSVFGCLRADGNKIYLTQELKRDDYMMIKLVLTNNLGKWVGGKTAAFVFDYDVEDLVAKLQSGEDVNLVKKFNFYPTQPGVCDFICQIWIPEDHHVLLEPSAGQGHIVEYVNNFNGRPVKRFDCVELNPINRGFLKKKGMNLIHDDFMTFEPPCKYDAVIANPPFDQYVEHIWKMTECSDNVISVVPAGFLFNNTKKIKDLRDYVNQHGSTYDLEKGSFIKSGTAVSTALVVIEK